MKKILILNQDKDSLYNIDTMGSVDTRGRDISVSDDIYKNSGVIIATYQTEERAREVFLELIEKLDNSNDTQNLIYKMPEK